MSSRTSSRSTLTTVPSTMSPSLKYLMVSSIAARNASSDPRSSMVTLLLVALEVASMLLVIWVVAPVGGRLADLPRPQIRRRTDPAAVVGDHGMSLTTVDLLHAEAHD